MTEENTSPWPTVKMISLILVAILFFVATVCLAGVGLFALIFIGPNMADGWQIYVPCFVLSSVCFVIGLFIPYRSKNALLVDTQIKDAIAQEEGTSLEIPSSKDIPASSFQITPLLQTIITGDLKLVQATLAEHPEQLNIAYAPNGNTPLHVAALNGKKEIMQFLLAQPGIDKDRKNNDGKTAFDLSAKKI